MSAGTFPSRQSGSSHKLTETGARSSDSVVYWRENLIFIGDRRQGVLCKVLIHKLLVVLPCRQYPC